MWASQTTASIEDVVRRFIVSTFLFGCDDELDHHAPLHKTGVIDSTGLLELITFLEHTFHITIADEELVPENFDTFRNIVDFLRRKTVSVG